MNPEDPLTVYEAWDPRQAHLICQVLANADIEARVASDALEMGLGDIPFQHTTCPVMVRRVDFERARAVLAEFETRLAGGAGETPEESQPYCYHCGESVAVGDPRCPKCGQELDWTV